MIRIDNTLFRALAAAGLTGLPIVIQEDGEVLGREALTPDQQASLDAVLTELSAPEAALKAYAADKRWALETGGIAVTVGADTIPVSTARGDDRQALLSAFMAIKDDLRAEGAVFKFADGVPRQMSNADMLTIVRAAFTHIQTCFDIEGDVLTQIENGAITSTGDIDSAFALAFS